MGYYRVFNRLVPNRSLFGDSHEGHDERKGKRGKGRGKKIQKTRKRTRRKSGWKSSNTWGLNMMSEDACWDKGAQRGMET